MPRHSRVAITPEARLGVDQNMSAGYPANGLTAEAREAGSIDPLPVALKIEQSGGCTIATSRSPHVHDLDHSATCWGQRTDNPVMGLPMR